MTHALGQTAGEYHKGTGPGLYPFGKTSTGVNSRSSTLAHRGISCNGSKESLLVHSVEDGLPRVVGPRSL
eukprot:2833955-Karenia_brevis.AAC.1